MRGLIKILFLFGLMAAVTPFAANAFTIYLDQVNDNNTGTQGPWASVTLTDSTFNGKDSVHFNVAPIESAFTSIGTNFGLQTFYFNENTSFGSDLLIGNFDPAGWLYDYGTFNDSEFGVFEFKSNSDTGNNRANPLSFDVYTQAGTDLSIANFSSTLSTGGYLFSAHIADYTGGKSAKFATDGSPAPVPEPSTILLLGSGLAGLAFVARRRRKE